MPQILVRFCYPSRFHLISVVTVIQWYCLFENEMLSKNFVSFSYATVLLVTIDPYQTALLPFLVASVFIST